MAQQQVEVTVSVRFGVPAGGITDEVSERWGQAIENVIEKLPMVATAEVVEWRPV